MHNRVMATTPLGHVDFEGFLRWEAFKNFCEVYDTTCSKKVGFVTERQQGSRA